MNIPAGKIIIGLFIIMAVILAIGLTQGGQGTAPSSFIPSPEPTPTPIPTPSPSPTPTPTPSPKYNWEIVDFSYKVTEKNPTWWKFSWQLTVKNMTTSILILTGDINFLDKDGFILDDDPIFEELQPGKQKTFRGYALIDTDMASDVKRAEVALEKW